MRLAPLGNAASGMQNNAMTKEEYEIEGTLDPGFKRLLKNEAAMVSFLNAILHSEDKIESVTFKDSEFDVHGLDLQFCNQLG